MKNIIHAWRCWLCEWLIYKALLVAPDDYCPSCVQVVVDTYNDKNSLHELAAKANQRKRLTTGAAE